MCQNYAAVSKKTLHVKVAYSVPELATMMGINRKSTARLLARMKVPVHRATKRGKGWVWLKDLKACAPDVWDSLLEAETVRRFN